MDIASIDEEDELKNQANAPVTQTKSEIPDIEYNLSGGPNSKKPVKQSNTLIKLLKVQQKAPDEAKICSKMQYQFYDTDSIIFQQGDQSNDKMYVIIQGQVGIYVLKDINVFAQQNLTELKKQQQEVAKAKSAQFKKRPSKHYTPNGLKRGSSMFDANDRSRSRQENSELKLSRKNPDSHLENDISVEGANGNEDKGIVSFDKLSGIADLESSLNSNERQERFLKERKKRTSVQEKFIDSDSDTEAIFVAELNSIDQNSEITENIGARNQKRAGIFQQKQQSSLVDHQLANLIKATHQKINEVKEGYCFGEQALMQDSNAKRSATIIALQPISLIIIHQEHFNQVLKKFNKESGVKLQVIKDTIPFCRQINSLKILDGFSYITKEILMGNGNVLTREGEKGDQIYMIRDGQIRIEKKIEILDPSINSKVTRSVRICEIDQYSQELIGEEILFKNEDTYQYTATVVSQYVYLYAIQKGNLLFRFPQESIEGIKENLRIKKQNRQKYLEFVMEMNKKENTHTENVFQVQQYLTSGASQEKMVKNLRESYEHKIDIRAAIDLKDRGHVQKCLNLSDQMKIQLEQRATYQYIRQKMFDHMLTRTQQALINQERTPQGFQRKLNVIVTELPKRLSPTGSKMLKTFLHTEDQEFSKISDLKDGMIREELIDSKTVCLRSRFGQKREIGDKDRLAQIENIQENIQRNNPGYLGFDDNFYGQTSLFELIRRGLIKPGTETMYKHLNKSAGNVRSKRSMSGLTQKMENTKTIQNQILKNTIYRIQKESKFSTPLVLKSSAKVSSPQINTNSSIISKETSDTAVFFQQLLPNPYNVKCGSARQHYKQVYEKFQKLQQKKKNRMGQTDDNAESITENSPGNFDEQEEGPYTTQFFQTLYTGNNYNDNDPQSHRKMPRKTRSTTDNYQRQEISTQTFQLATAMSASSNVGVAHDGSSIIPQGSTLTIVGAQSIDNANANENTVDAFLNVNRLLTKSGSSDFPFLNQLAYTQYQLKQSDSANTQLILSKKASTVRPSSNQRNMQNSVTPGAYDFYGHLNEKNKFLVKMKAKRSPSRTHSSSIALRAKESGRTEQLLFHIESSIKDKEVQNDILGKKQSSLGQLEDLRKAQTQSLRQQQAQVNNRGIQSRQPPPKYHQFYQTNNQIVQNNLFQ